MIRKEARPFCRTSSSVRVWWEFTEPDGPKERKRKREREREVDVERERQQVTSPLRDHAHLKFPLSRHGPVFGALVLCIKPTSSLPVLQIPSCITRQTTIELPGNLHRANRDFSCVTPSFQDRMGPPWERQAGAATCLTGVTRVQGHPPPLARSYAPRYRT